MAVPPSLLDSLLALSGPVERRGLLAAHAGEIDDAFAQELAAASLEATRSDALAALELAALLEEAGRLAGNDLYRAQAGVCAAGAYAVGGLGEYARAVVLCDEAIALFTAAGHPREAAVAQIPRIYALAMLGRSAEAFAAARHATDVFQQLGDRQLLASVTLNLAIVHSRLGQDEEALRLYDFARDLLTAPAENEDAAPVLSEEFIAWELAGVDLNRAVSLRRLGRFAAAIAAAESAAGRLTGLGLEAEAARAREEVAFACFQLGRYDEALDLLQRAYDLFTSMGRPADALEVALYRAECLLRLGRWAEARESAVEVAAGYARLDSGFEEGYADLLAGAAHAGLGDYAAALTALDRAAARFAAHGSPAWEAAACLERAAVLLSLGRAADALADAVKCRRQFARSARPLEQGRAALVAGRASLALDDTAAARAYADEALAAAADHAAPLLAFGARVLLAALADRRGDALAALDLYSAAADDLEQLGGSLMVEFRPAFLADKQAVYAEAAALCLRLGRAADAFDYAERAKSRALLDLVAGRRTLAVEARSPGDAPLVDELARLRAERTALLVAASLELPRPDTPLPAARPGPLVRLERRITDVWHTLLIRSSDYAADASLWRVRVEPVQGYLREDAALLEYFSIQGRLALFVVRRDTVQAVPLPPAEANTLAGAARLLRLLHLNMDMAPAAAPAERSALEQSAVAVLRRLHDALFAPAQELLAGVTRLTVVPHGPLHYLPFHALHDGAGYLLERFEFTVLPAASFLRYCAEAAASHAGPQDSPLPAQVAAFGHSYHGVLPHAPAEAQTVARTLGGRAYVEEEAAAAAVRAAAGAARVLHLAAHGDFRPDNPLFSGIALHDGWLTTLDLFDLRLPAALVTLSACRTGRAVVGGGDELLGLMRALFAAGAASLALSLWSVEDQSTTALMALFYAGLALGMGKAAALRAAQLAFLRSAEAGPAAGAPARPWLFDHWRHPYYWAPFFLAGDGGPL